VKLQTASQIFPPAGHYLFKNEFYDKRKYYKTKILIILMKEVFKKKVRPNQRKAQIWVETVIYTMIAFLMIGLVLAFAKPKIEETQDKAIIEQSIKLMEEIDLTISEIVQGSAGNKRVMEIGIKKGFLKIDGKNDLLVFEFEGKYTYSEPGIPISDGNLIILTEQTGKINSVNITRSYDYNLTYEDGDELKSFGKSATSYTLLISNEGKDAQDKTRINFKIS